MTTQEQTTFDNLKNEILKSAKEAHACTEQYARAHKSKTIQELCQVIKDNFHWACNNKVLTVDIIERYRDEFANNDIYCNVSVERGYLLCNNATVTAYHNATVEAYDNATVEACNNATVTAYHNATIEAYDNATVKACNNATLTATPIAHLIA